MSDDSECHAISDISTENHSKTQSEQKIVELSDEKDIQSIISEFHLTPIGGHQDVLKTYKRLKSYYTFPEMISRVKSFIRKCKPCELNNI